MTYYLIIWKVNKHHDASYNPSCVNDSIWPLEGKNTRIFVHKKYVKKSLQFWALDVFEVYVIAITNIQLHMIKSSSNDTDWFGW